MLREHKDDWIEELLPPHDATKEYVQEVSVISTTRQHCIPRSSHRFLDLTSNSVHYVHKTLANRHYNCHLRLVKISLGSRCQDDLYIAWGHSVKDLRHGVLSRFMEEVRRRIWIFLLRAVTLWALLVFLSLGEALPPIMDLSRGWSCYLYCEGHWRVIPWASKVSTVRISGGYHRTQVHTDIIKRAGECI